MSRAYSCLPSLVVTRGDFALRPLDDADIEPIRRWRNAQMDVLRQKEPLTREAQQLYFVSTIWPEMELKQPRTILVAILRNGERIGYGGLVHCAWEHVRAEISVLFAPGIAAENSHYRECLTAFLDMLEEIAFDRLGFNRLTLETYDIRSFHIAVLERAGYVREGRLRDHVSIAGEGVDSLLHAKIARERGRCGASAYWAGGRTTSIATRSILDPAAGGS